MRIRIWLCFQITCQTRKRERSWKPVDGGKFFCGQFYEIAATSATRHATGVLSSCKLWTKIAQHRKQILLYSLKRALIIKSVTRGPDKSSAWREKQLWSDTSPPQIWAGPGTKSSNPVSTDLSSQYGSTKFYNNTCSKVKIFPMYSKADMSNRARV